MSAPGAESGHEQRRHPRVTLRRDVSCEWDGHSVRSRFGDVSVGGMFVDSFRPPFPPGATVAVTLFLSPGEPPLTAQAEVAYVQERLGMGLRFLDLTPADLERVGRYVDDVMARRLPSSELDARKSARVSINVHVTLRAGAEAGDFEDSTSLITLSKHGACVLTDRPLERGARVFVTTPAGLEFQGNVVWVGTVAGRGGGQVGIQCRGLAQALGFDFP
jgi:hypothetical protein